MIIIKKTPRRVHYIEQCYFLAIKFQISLNTKHQTEETVFFTN